jgi:hypothetical protein
MSTSTIPTKSHFYIKELHSKNEIIRDGKVITVPESSHPIGCIAIQKIDTGYLISWAFNDKVGKKSRSKSYIRQAAYGRLDSDRQVSFIREVPETFARLCPLIGLNNFIRVSNNHLCLRIDIASANRGMRSAFQEVNPMERTMESVG